MLPDGTGKLWLGTRQGLNLFDPKTGKSKVYVHDPQDPDTITSNWIADLVIDQSGLFVDWYPTWS